MKKRWREVLVRRKTTKKYDGGERRACDKIILEDRQGGGTLFTWKNKRENFTGQKGTCHPRGIQRAGDWRKNVGRGGGPCRNRIGRLRKKSKL